MVVCQNHEYIESNACLPIIFHYFTKNADEGICMRVELFLEGDDDALEAIVSLMTDVISHLQVKQTNNC